MKINWKNIFKIGLNNNSQENKRERLKYGDIPDLIYAIGDVHGCLDLLLELEAKIKADCVNEQALIIMLGDYVDRGPNSSGVIEHLINSPNFNAKRICLLGNHELTMLDFIENPKQNASWLEFGGQETLLSYGLSEDDIKQAAFNKKKFAHKINSFIPYEHINFLKQLPILLQYPEHVFVHAGIRVNIAMKDQQDADFLWIRDDFIKNSDKLKTLVIHGHTMNEEVFISNKHINLDTGAYATSRLSAAKFVKGKLVKILST